MSADHRAAMLHERLARTLCRLFSRFFYVPGVLRESCSVAARRTLRDTGPPVLYVFVNVFADSAERIHDSRGVIGLTFSRQK